MNFNKNALLTIIFSMVITINVWATKPNIIFIFADDWGWGDLSCHGHPYVKTLTSIGLPKKARTSLDSLWRVGFVPQVVLQ